MKRTITPEQRKKFLQENIMLNIEEKDNALAVKVLLHNVQQQGYPDNAKIILEVYNRINIEQLQLGEVKEYRAEEQSYPLPFEVPVRAKINFRLKIIDPTSFKLLGYAENLKEEKYSKSLLDFNTEDENVKNIYKIDFANREHPILYLNPKLSPYLAKLKPVIAEMAFKDILTYLLLQDDDNGDEDFKDHKWFRFAEQYSTYDETEKQHDEEYDLIWINEILCKFSEDKKLIASITKEFKVND